MDYTIPQNTKQIAKELIKEGEGLKLTVYIDTVGHQTIGYGHKLLPSEKDKLKEITKEKASELLESDMNTAITTVIQYWQTKHKALNEMNAERIAVLIDMTYNLGSIAWPKLTEAIKQKNWQKAGDEIMDSKYAIQVGNRAKRNANMMRDGELHSK